jgi:hypothetical protein
MAQTVDIKCPKCASKGYIFKEVKAASDNTFVDVHLRCANTKCLTEYEVYYQPTEIQVLQEGFIDED